MQIVCPSSNAITNWAPFFRSFSSMNGSRTLYVWYVWFFSFYCVSVCVYEWIYLSLGCSCECLVIYCCRCHKTLKLSLLLLCSLCVCLSLSRFLALSICVFVMWCDVMWCDMLWCGVATHLYCIRLHIRHTSDGLSSTSSRINQNST